MYFHNPQGEVSSVFADPNTRQEYQVEGEISHEAVTDTSSDSEENRNGNIQPENKLQQKDEYWRYIPLVKAALAGNWEIAKRFFDQDKVACTVPITKFLETALHIAVGTGKALHFVEKLVEAMPLEAITLCDDKGFTALHTAALGGNTAAAMILVKKHSALLHIRGGRDKLSIHVAAMHGHKETLCYLLRVTKDDPASKAYQGESGNWLLKFIMASKFYGVPESCSKDHNRGDIENPINMSPKYNWAPFLGANFCISAHKVSQKLHFILWKVFEFAAPQIKDIREKKQKHNQALQLAKCLCKAIQSLNDSDAYESHAKVPLFKAAKLGVHEVVEEIVDSFPSLVWATDSNEYSIFHHAIVQRHENVYNLLYQMSEHKRFMTYFRDNDNNTKLHLAGKLAPQNKLNLVPGAALQMQRELQWFEEVKKFVIPYQMDWRNRNQDTAEMVFTNAHKELLVEGEKWMTHTANSCTIVAALIVTIAFAASISVPGGHNDVKGLPILSNEAAFIVFAISNAFSLFTSTTSLMMFLSILTSTYSEKDFLFALPKRLIIGLVTLFFSITTMMVAFSSIVYLLFGYNKRWVLIPTGVFSGIPIISFVFLEFPLLLDLITSYGGGIFGKKSNRLFY
ncbi:ankyrin repeat-containing protein NPR4-like isoform X4 [Actinidia eriantha]|uniref:ankyrin repeat-containing protein NPR4-like isoform X4 n=1 Tax=Actinidia eriantha TaxID=165200 RepID=UPI00258481AF|nr:ankyrin repeat-containing protein NPR4-like isoform X4 [Actinidia eriantha]